MAIESVSSFMAKQGLMVVTQASKHNSPLPNLVIIQPSKENGQGNPAEEKNQPG